MIEITGLENAPDLDHPRRVMKYVLIWCSSGTLTVMVEFKEETTFGKHPFDN